MALARLERVAIGVDDINKMAADLRSIFEMDLTLVDVPDMGFRVGFGEDGLELVQLDEGRARPALWKGPLGALCFACDDLDAVAARVEAAGYHTPHEVIAGGGIREILFPDFNGLPLVLYNRSEKGIVKGMLSEDGTVSIKVIGEHI